MSKKKLYQWLRVALAVLLALAILLTLSIVGAYFWGQLKRDAYTGPCETGEGIIAGMPCPETPRGGVK